MGLARNTLERAAFFVDRAEAVGLADRAAFQHFLEAAIVFARSVTFHLQKEYAHEAGFADWYVSMQQRLRADALASFFLEKRNYVLKEGPLKIGKHVDLHLHAAVTLTASVNVKVIRGNPWYRRSPNILFQDLTYPLRNWARSCYQEWRRRLQARRQPKTSRDVAIKETFRFAEPPWNTRPATVLLREYLDTLRQLVGEAEKRFGPGDSETA